MATASVSPSVSLQLPPSSQNMKRKLDVAIQSLDDAVSESTERPSLPKKSRSLYSTLVKYGIKTKDSKLPSVPNRLESLSQTAPHLAAIISRSSKSRGPSVAISTTALTVAPSSCSQYRPSSTAHFLARLSTYRLATYTNKPPEIDAVAAAKCGWINDGRDRLACGVCKASWVVASTQGMNREAANSLVEKQRLQLVSSHKDGCPWKSQQCDASVYRLPVQSPAATAKEVKARALDLEPILDDVQIKHPLSSGQVQSFISTLKMFNVVRPSSSDGSSPSSDAVYEQEEPSETAALTSLFGWNLPSLLSTDRSSSSSATSIAPSTPRQSLSRANSICSLRNPDRSDTLQSSPLIMSRRDSKQQRDCTLLYCRMCQRRVGLWAFGPSASVGTRRQFDLLKEHRPYCPYIVRSTIVPALPMPSGHSAVLNGAVTSTGSPLSNRLIDNVAVEGWRAILSIILKSRNRKKLGTQRDSAPVDPIADGDSVASIREEDMVVDRVEALVDGVKRRGGKELLKYVKGLLG